MEAMIERFCQACITGDLSLVQDLLKTHPGLVDCLGKVRPDHREFMRKNDSEGGWTPLHLAAHYGQMDVVKVLIQKGANVNRLSENGEANTPLMAAIAGGRLENVRTLLENGGDPLKTDASGEFNAVKLAVVDKKPEISALLNSFLNK